MATQRSMLTKAPILTPMAGTGYSRKIQTGLGGARKTARAEVPLTLFRSTVEPLQKALPFYRLVASHPLRARLVLPCGSGVSAPVVPVQAPVMHGLGYVFGGDDSHKSKTIQERHFGRKTLELYRK